MESNNLRFVLKNMCPMGYSATAKFCRVRLEKEKKTAIFTPNAEMISHAMRHGKEDHVAEAGQFCGIRLDEHHVATGKPLAEGIDAVEPLARILTGSGGHETHGRMRGKYAGKFHPGVACNADKSGSDHDRSPRRKAGEKAPAVLYW